MSNNGPTTAQVSLAIDILSGLELNDTTRCLHQKAASLVASALAMEHWTGVSNGCSAYGAPPVSDDMGASRKVMLVDKLHSIGALDPANARTRMEAQLFEDAKAIYADG